MEWKTELTEVQPDKISIRGRPIGEIMDNFNFGEAVFLLFKGEPPDKAQGKMMNAILVATMDHSVMAPSACATRFVASGGSPIQSAVAAGIQALGSHHGGAIEEAQALMMDGVKRSGDEGKSLEDTALEIAKEYRREKRRVPGYGHPYHKKDPRTTRLLDMAAELDFTGDHVRFCRAMGDAIEEVLGRRLTVNVDAAMAAVLADMGFPWELARGFFIVSRAAGLVAHAHEEYTKEKPFRAVPLEEVTYMGPKGS